MADDVGEVDDESLLLLSIAGALAAAAAVAASRERGTFIRIHFGTDFAFSFDALFIETFYLRLPNRICFLRLLLFSSLSIITYWNWFWSFFWFCTPLLLHSAQVASSHFANCINLTLL